MVRTVFVAFGLLVVLVGAPASAVAQDASQAVSVQDDQFVPAMSSVTATAVLTWQNDGAERHTVTADNGAFSSAFLVSGESFAFTFDTPGTYPYYCSIHGGPNGQGMSGIVVVN